ncbi:TBATA protein, partial [Polypterus senegalus]
MPPREVRTGQELPHDDVPFHSPGQRVRLLLLEACDGIGPCSGDSHWPPGVTRGAAVVERRTEKSDSESGAGDSGREEEGDAAGGCWTLALALCSFCVFPVPQQGGQQLAGRVTSTGRLREDQRRRSEELLVLDLLCQILHTDSLTAVQTWLLTASDTEKDKVLSLIHRVTSGCQPEVQPTQSEEQKLPAIAVPCTSSDLPTTPVKSQKKVR